MPGGGKLPDSCDHSYRILPCISASWQGNRYVVCTNKIGDTYEWKSMPYISSHPLRVSLSEYYTSENWPMWNIGQSMVLWSGEAVSQGSERALFPPAM